MELSSTDGATSTAPLPSYDKARLTGKLVRVLPYARGYYPRDVLYSCWAIMEQDGLAQRVFHSAYHSPELPIDTRGDLNEFIQYFAAPNRLLQICQSIETDEIAGFIWFEDIYPKLRASCGIFFRRKYWGSLTKEASTICRQYAFEALDIPLLYCFTPWRDAKRHAEQIGFQCIATLPGLIPQEQDEPLPMYVLLTQRGPTHGRQGR